MNLYEITQDYRQQLAALSELDIDPQTVQDTLEGLQGDLQQKLRAVIAYSLELDILAAGAAEHAERMADRAKALSARVEWLRTYALDAMQAAGLPEVSTAEFAAKVAKKPPAVSVTDISKLPPCFLHPPKPAEPQPDKAAIATALKAGEEVPGAVLTQGYRLAIR